VGRPARAAARDGRPRRADAGRPAARPVRRRRAGGPVDRDAPLAVGGIDVGVAGPSSPTTVSADGMLRTPRVVGARDAAVYLLACRDPTRAGSCTPSRPRPVPSTAHAHARPARDLSTVHWPLSADTLLAYGVAAEASVGLMADRGAAGSAAFTSDRAGRSHDHHGGDYAKERQQFGKPIGSFQAVKHLLANARVKLEFARPATYRAAWSLATAQPTVSHDASMAKAWPRTPPTWPPGSPSRCTAPSATPGSAISTSS
jgi:hypothetical protein